MNPDASYVPAFKRIVFCTDFSREADFAFSFAVDLAQRYQAGELYLLHVIPDSEAQFWKTYIYEVEGVDEKARHDIDEQIDRTYRRRMPEGLELKVEFRIGKENLEILDFAASQQVDLIVIGHHRGSGLAKAFLGDASESIVRKACCPILVVPLNYAQRHREP